MECLEGWMVGWLDEVEGAGRGATVFAKEESNVGRSKGREEVGT